MKNKILPKISFFLKLRRKYVCLGKYYLLKVYGILRPTEHENSIQFDQQSTIYKYSSIYLSIFR